MDTLLVDQPHEGVTRITLDRPERLNAMNATLIAELHQALAGIAIDRSCRVVVLTGAGRGFCAGIDLAGYGEAPGSAELDRVGATFATQTHIAQLVPLVRSLPQPVIAAVNGAAAGGGLALALASDVRIASRSARFNVAFVRLGLSGCDIGVSWLLPRLIGASRAWELMLTGRIIDAEEADRIGLVLRVVPDDELMAAAARDGGAHCGKRTVGSPDDQGSDVVATRGGLTPGGHRLREPHAGPVLNDRRHAGGGGRLPPEAPPSVRECCSARTTSSGCGPAAGTAAHVTTLCRLMRRPPNLTRAAVRRLPLWSGAWVALALLLAGCSTGGTSNSGLADPAHSVAPVPDYPSTCAPVGVDSTSPCLRITLDAIDAARAAEGLRPMELPADFAALTVPEQLFVAIDRERVDRGLAPFTGLSTALDADAQEGADAARLPAQPGPAYGSVDTEWIGDVDNGLDADFEWLYNDGPHSGVPGCSRTHDLGLLGRPADRPQPVRYTTSRHGSRLRPDRRHIGCKTPAGPRWRRCSAPPLVRGRTPTPGNGHSPPCPPGRSGLCERSPPRSPTTGIDDPTQNVSPEPDYTRVCVATGIDNSASCLDSVLEAINHAHALEGIQPMVLPANFAQMSIPEQLFVAVNLERVDRGLPAFGGLTAALNRNAQKGADDANDPPTRGRPTTSTTPSGPEGRPTGSTPSTGGCTTTASTAATWTACTGEPPAAGATGRASSTTSARAPIW